MILLLLEWSWSGFAARRSGGDTSRGRWRGHFGGFEADEVEDKLDEVAVEVEDGVDELPRELLVDGGAGAELGVEPARGVGVGAADGADDAAVEAEVVPAPDRLVVLLLAEVVGGRLPVPARHLRAAREPHPLALFRRVDERLDERRRLLVLPGLVEVAVVAGLADDVGDAARAHRHDGHAARHRLEHDEPERLRLARHGEHVARGVRRAQLLALEHPHKLGRRALEVLLELRAHGAVADDGEAVPREHREHPLERLNVLLRPEAPDVHDDGRLGVPVREPRAHLRRAEPWVEHLAVDSALPHLDRLLRRHLLLVQLLLQHRGRHERQVRRRVQHPDHPPNRPHHPFEGVPRHVLWDVRVVRQHQRLAQHL
mmetsp:Transcript_1176/g.4409  ORF Transcript_1176/g.4409 Transcript_1176/m.4409 type:complete len:371 (+) Transcript_1176:24-1136(+)